MINTEYGLNCGGFSYTLEYLDGSLLGTTEPDLTYSLFETADLVNNELIKGTPGTFSWLGNSIYTSETH